MEYLYGKDKSIISKKVNSKAKILTINEISQLIDNKKNICDKLKNEYYIETFNTDICDCGNKEIEFMSISSIHENVIEEFFIRSFCNDQCYGNYESSLYCGGYPILCTMARKRDNEWVVCERNDISYIESQNIHDFTLSENQYYKKKKQYLLVKIMR